MPDSIGYPIDLDLWRERKKAPKTDWWKWDWATWAPVISRVFADETEFRNLACPVCAQKQLYGFFLAVSIVIHKSEQEGRRVYVADKWFGCHNCKTQVRDRGEMPRWVKDEDVKWASEGLRQRAEQKLTQGRDSSEP